VHVRRPVRQQPRLQQSAATRRQLAGKEKKQRATPASTPSNGGRGEKRTHADEREVDGRLLDLLRRGGGRLAAGRAHPDGAEARHPLPPRRAERAALLPGAAAAVAVGLGERGRGDAEEAGELHGGIHFPAVCEGGALGLRR